MPAITNEMIHASYDIAKKIYEGKLTDRDGLDSLVNDYEMNRNSAADYIYNYKCMRKGRRFVRTNNLYGTEYFLENIHNDSGRENLLNALSSLWQHIDYFEAISNTKLHKQRELFSKFSQKASVVVEEIFPDEIIEDNKTLFEGKIKKVPDYP